MTESRKPPENWPNGSKVTAAADGGRDAAEIGRVVRNGTVWDMWSLRGDAYQHAGTAATQVEGITKLPAGSGSVASQAQKTKEPSVPAPPVKGAKGAGVGKRVTSAKPAAGSKAAAPAAPAAPALAGPVAGKARRA